MQKVPTDWLALMSCSHKLSFHHTALCLDTHLRWTSAAMQSMLPNLGITNVRNPGRRRTTRARSLAYRYRGTSLMPHSASQFGIVTVWKGQYIQSGDDRFLRPCQIDRDSLSPQFASRFPRSCMPAYDNAGKHLHIWQLHQHVPGFLCKQNTSWDGLSTRRQS